MNDTASEKPLSQFFLLGSNVAKLGWGKVGATKDDHLKVIQVITLGMLSDLGIPRPIRTEFDAFLKQSFDIKQLIKKIPEIKSLLGLYIGNSIGKKQMQAFYLGFNIVNIMPMCEMASIEMDNPSLTGARAAVDELLNELIVQADALEIDTNKLRSIHKRSQLAKKAGTFDQIRSELINCGQSFVDELEKMTSLPVKPEKSQHITTAREYKNPWISGSFYLAALVIILIIFLVLAKELNPFVVPLVIIGALLSVSLIGALQLRQDKELSQKNFLELMALTFRYLPKVGGEKKK